MIIRTDLPRGMQLAQLVHAAGESSPGNLSSGTYAVVLQVKNEAALRDVVQLLERHGVLHVPIYEPDAPYNGALMAVGCRPGRKGDVGRFLSSLPLAR